ncbi:TonB-dependent receptor [Methylophaga marina]|uniref:TonB-dependent receptor n=1 Tax=Methylophaga marina TaxID=45495 RepID=A0ABN0TJ71_9GAMM|nr:TonB-dependent receptor [Methylophaga marina]BDZ75333.1 TonB-dependent receptor [Methylophaga marina]
MKKTNLMLERPSFKLSLIALGISSFISNGVQAEDDLNLETVRVIGQAVQIDKALTEQRNSNSIESVVHADGIGQLPDDNAAEALQRLPGVSVANDQGEGRFVTVRGLAPELNAVTINGTNVPSPESDTRAVALDVLPSELVQSLSVVKTLTPDMDANSLGGTINVRSLSAFDHDGLFYTLSTEGSFDDNTDQISPKGSGAVSNIFSIGDGVDNFGVAAALSWQKRDFGSDNVETGGAWDFDGSQPRLEELEQRDYEISRERLGLGVNFDYKADVNTSYYLRTLFSRFTDTETRNAAGIEFADPLLPNESGDDAEGFRELKDREETQEIQSYVFGGEKTIGLWKIDGQIGYSRASEDTPGHLAGAKFVGDFDNVSYSGTSKPRLNAGSDYYDPASFELDEVEWEEQKTTDTEKNIKIDLARDFDIQGYASQLKFGGKLSRREKDNEVDAWAFEDFGTNDTSLAAYSAGNVDYSLNRYGQGISSSALERLIGRLDKAGNVDAEESQINDFVMNEDINAAYVMNTLDLDDWTIIAGLRYEGTEFKAKGTGIRDGNFEAISSKNSYHNWLPGLHLRYYLDDKTQVRAAWTNSVVRPTFEALAPGFAIDGDEASFGNPDLDPMTSKNLDLGIEHYMGRAGAVSAYVFYKDISDFVYNTDLGGTGMFTDFDQAETFDNGDTAKVYGLELAYTQKLSWLPAPWNGLLLGANATFSQSDAEIEGLGQKRDIDLPGQSNQVANLMVGWENDKLSMRLSANYKSSYLSEVAGIDDKEHDQYVDSQLFLDFSTSYFVTKNAQITLEAKNLTDEEYYVYTGSSAYNAQYEEYGPSIKLGFTLTNF